jgi:hypothetical protein
VDAIALGSRSTVLKLAFILVVGHGERVVIARKRVTEVSKCRVLEKWQ